MAYGDPPVKLNRNIFRSLLNNDYEIQTITRVSDGQGGAYETYTPLMTVRGRMRPIYPWEMETANRLDYKMSHVLYVEAPLELPDGVSFEIVDRRGKKFRLRGIHEPSYAGFHLQVHVEEEVGTEWTVG